MLAAILNDPSSVSTRIPIDFNPNSSTFPEDLRDWLEPSALTTAILEAVQTLYWNDGQVDDVDENACEQQSTLCVLVYGHAIGLSLPEEIVDRLQTDQELRYLSLHKQISASKLFLFKTQNRELVKRCLSHVLRHAWQVHFGKSFSNSKMLARWDGAFRTYFDAEASIRMGHSVQSECPPAYDIVEGESSKRTQTGAKNHRTLGDILRVNFWPSQPRFALISAMALLLLIVLACIASKVIETGKSGANARGGFPGTLTAESATIAEQKSNDEGRSLTV